MRLVLANVIIWSAAGLVAFEAISPNPTLISSDPGAEVSTIRIAYETLEVPSPSVAMVDTIAARPLFTPNRRPPAEREVVAGSDRPRFRLTGIGGVADGLTAHIAGADGKVGLYVVGQVVDGWTVAEVRKDGAALSRQGKRFELTFTSHLADPPTAKAASTVEAGGGAASTETPLNLFTGNVDQD